jgi:hypothetical protein
MRYRRKDNHAITCEVDFIQASESSAIILDDGPFRCCRAEEFDKEWEEDPDDKECESPVMRIDKLKAVAKAAAKLLSPPYSRFGIGLHVHHGVREANDWIALRDALSAAGVDWEEYT